VKICRLRVELGDVAFGIRAALERACQVVVDVIKTDASAVNLTAYFCFTTNTKTTNKSSTNCSDILISPTDEMKQRINRVIGQLTVKLPCYMVPSFFIHCRYMPVSTSTKIDRNMLKRHSALLSREDLSKYSLQGGKKRAPETAIETKLQRLWADVL
ncbi:hypothetical protein LZ30DRAFT_792169, partial [Colletotrichum cereale]